MPVEKESLAIVISSPIPSNIWAKWSDYSKMIFLFKKYLALNHNSLVLKIPLLALLKIKIIAKFIELVQIQATSQKS